MLLQKMYRHNSDNKKKCAEIKKSKYSIDCNLVDIKVNVAYLKNFSSRNFVNCNSNNSSKRWYC